MIFSDVEIKTSNAVGNISIYPIDMDNVQPNSYEVTIDKEIYISSLDKDGNLQWKRDVLPYTLKHGDFILASTKECIELRRDVCAMVCGKSTLGRHGISIHQTAGFIDCGFKGNITLEISNLGGNYVLKEGCKIAQIVFMNTKTPQNKYGECNNHYQEQKGVTLPYDMKERKTTKGENK